jgi:hypothetical protein
MTRKASFVVPPFFEGNRLFSTDPKLNRDNCLTAYHATKAMFAEHGVSLDTHDITPPDAAEIVLYMDMPKELPRVENKAKSFLIIGEVPAVMPGNWVMDKHDRFAKIFTFCDDYVDNVKYFRLNSSRKFDPDVPVDVAEKTKFACLIASNKTSRHPLELYSQRVAITRWFEGHHPDQFDLYGMGWDKKTFTGLLRPLNRVPQARKALAPKYPSYRGTVGSKFEVLRHYKFSVAFENCRDLQGYVTGDKIFDPMQAGCIPLYWGAPNITDYVPAECFVDVRQFDGWADLHRYMATMDVATHRKYLRNIKDYITGTAMHGPFSDTAFAQILTSNLL